MAKIFVLEGLPGMGKTTLIKRLGRYKDTDIVHQIILKRPTAKPGERFFLRNDTEKYKKAMKSKKAIVIMDRNYLSTLSFNFSKLPEGDISFLMVAAWYIYERLMGNIRPPDFYIYIEGPPGLSTSRKRHSKSSIWGSERHLSLMGSFYDFFFRFVEPGCVRISSLRTVDRIEQEIRKSVLLE